MKLNELPKKALKYAGKKAKETILGDAPKTGEELREKQAVAVVRHHVLVSMGAGLIPYPILDIVAVSAVQLDMIKQLCQIYQVDYSSTQGKALVSALTSSSLASIAARGAASAIKAVPGIGSMIGGLTMTITTGGATYALGQVFKHHFSVGGTILDFDPERLRKMYKEQFEKGKKVAAELRKKSKKVEKQFEEEVVEAPLEAELEEKPILDKTAKLTATNAIDKLKELGDLREKGVITEDEFAQMKAKVFKEI